MSDSLNKQKAPAAEAHEFRSPSCSFGSRFFSVMSWVMPNVPMMLPCVSRHGISVFVETQVFFPTRLRPLFLVIDHRLASADHVAFIRQGGLCMFAGKQVSIG